MMTRTFQGRAKILATETCTNNPICQINDVPAGRLVFSRLDGLKNIRYALWIDQLSTFFAFNAKATECGHL
jgi:hypothetical protein